MLGGEKRSYVSSVVMKRSDERSGGGGEVDEQGEAWAMLEEVVGGVERK